MVAFAHSDRYVHTWLTVTGSWILVVRSLISTSYIEEEKSIDVLAFRMCVSRREHEYITDGTIVTWKQWSFSLFLNLGSVLMFSEGCKCEQRDIHEIYRETTHIVKSERWTIKSASLRAIMLMSIDILQVSFPIKFYSIQTSLNRRKESLQIVLSYWIATNRELTIIDLVSNKLTVSNRIH